ncbi:hypothetical protein [Chengkuizengella axinellae]|uniref:Lantibiotic biosynthesis protein n=1 Tax=Chengkuizengella axinellae TaxID=3064388 RepID=A0ABT9ITK9_9BACL|nr:hypothetical protein [Chengkuizengella sp. 2205SS18-9]MDP5272678.1 hypothetical protein [Chengkuizengella sp. 2205SS18-9]
MNFYEVTCYVNEENPNHPVFKTLKNIAQNEQSSTLIKGWQHGYHVKIIGFLDGEKVDKYFKLLSSILENEPTYIYSTESFKKKYKKISEITNHVQANEEIYQNKVIIKQITDCYHFENMKQLQLYVFTHQIFDSFYIDNYWKENDILTIVHDIYLFVKLLPDKVISERDLLYSNGYTSHLSHYIGFLNSLKQNDRKRIQQMFKKRVTDDIRQLKDGTQKGNVELVSKLFEVYQFVSKYVDDGMINFHSPHSSKQFNSKVNQSSIRHASIFEDEELKEAVLRDKVLCTNKWILNVLYEKLVLLNIKPIEKFYMNYLISLMRYEEKLLEVN